MAFDQQLLEKVRQALAKTPNVVEKKMFGGIAFMVDDKMCVTVKDDKMMCRIDPELSAKEITKAEVSKVVMGGREYKGYIRVPGLTLGKKDFDYYIKLSLDYNKHIKKKNKS